MIFSCLLRWFVTFLVCVTKAELTFIQILSIGFACMGVLSKQSNQVFHDMPRRSNAITRCCLRIWAKYMGY